MSRDGCFFEGLNIFISSFQHRWSMGIMAIHTDVRTLESKANLNSSIKIDKVVLVAQCVKGLLPR